MRDKFKKWLDKKGWGKYFNFILWGMNILGLILPFASAFLINSFNLSYDAGDKLYAATLIVLFVLQLIKVVAVDPFIFNGQGIFSYTVLMFQGLFILAATGDLKYGWELVAVAGYILMVFWMGYFHFKDEVKRFNEVRKRKKLEEEKEQYHTNSFSERYTPGSSAQQLFIKTEGQVEEPEKEISLDDLYDDIH